MNGYVAGRDAIIIAVLIPSAFDGDAVVTYGARNRKYMQVEGSKSQKSNLACAQYAGVTCG